jgi:hypothetical protein
MNSRKVTMGNIRNEKEVLLNLIKHNGDCYNNNYVKCGECPIQSNRYCSGMTTDRINIYEQAMSMYFGKGYTEEDLVEYLL